MNKEQKSFGEYGAAWATTVVIHTYIRSLLKYRGTPLSPDALHTYRDKVLKDAWRWRRICRNITNKTPKKLASFPLKFMEPRKPTKRQVKPRKSFPVGNTKGDNA